MEILFRKVQNVYNNFQNKFFRNIMHFEKNIYIKSEKAVTTAIMIWCNDEEFFPTIGMQLVIV